MNDKIQKTLDNMLLTSFLTHLSNNGITVLRDGEKVGISDTFEIANQFIDGMPEYSDEVQK